MQTLRDSGYRAFEGLKRSRAIGAIGIGRQRARGAARGHGPRGRLRKMPGLRCGAVTIPNLEPCAVGCAAAGDVETAAGLWVHEMALLSPAPLLGASSVAVPKLDWRPVRGTTAADVDTFIQNTQRPVTATPCPTLRDGGVACPDLDHRAIICAGVGVIDALATIAQNRSGAAVPRLDYCRRIEVVACVDHRLPRARKPEAQRCHRRDRHRRQRARGADRGDGTGRLGRVPVGRPLHLARTGAASRTCCRNASYAASRSSSAVHSILASWPSAIPGTMTRPRWRSRPGRRGSMRSANGTACRCRPRPCSFR